MDKIIIHKNKGELFKCQLKVDGAAIKNTIVRLCLEFDNNKNLFFYGKVESDGKCVISIPKLKEIENTSGKLIVEAIADSTYFKLYEGEVELKNSIEIDFIKQTEVKETNVTLEEPIQTTKEEIKPKIKDEPKATLKEDVGFSKFQQYVKGKRKF